MDFRAQGTIGTTRYTVVPRTLCFVLCGEALLLLRGAPTKRLWANLLNGLGGHLEPGEDPRESALREIEEEAGFRPDSLSLRALVHVSGQEGHPGVLQFIYLGRTARRCEQGSDEGTLEWHPLDALPWDEMVPDLPHLLPRLLAAEPGALLYGHYGWDAGGRITYRWDTDTRA